MPHSSVAEPPSEEQPQPPSTPNTTSNMGGKLSCTKVSQDAESDDNHPETPGNVVSTTTPSAAVTPATANQVITSSTTWLDLYPSSTTAPSNTTRRVRPLENDRLDRLAAVKSKFDSLRSDMSDRHQVLELLHKKPELLNHPSTPCWRATARISVRDFDSIDAAMTAQGDRATIKQIRAWETKVEELRVSMLSAYEADSMPRWMTNKKEDAADIFAESCGNWKDATEKGGPEIEEDVDPLEGENKNPHWKDAGNGKQPKLWRR